MISKETKKYIDGKFIPSIQRYYIKQEIQNTELIMVILAFAFVTSIIFGLGYNWFYVISILLGLSFIWYMVKLIDILKALKKIDEHIKKVE